MTKLIETKCGRYISPDIIQSIRVRHEYDNHCSLVVRIPNRVMGLVLMDGPRKECESSLKSFLTMFEVVKFS